MVDTDSIAVSTAHARKRGTTIQRLVCAIAAGTFLAAQPASAEMQRRTVAVDETTRNYLVFYPDRPAPAGGLPLVVVLHGGATVADMILHYSRFNDVAARENFAVAYPYGVNRWWNDGRLIGGRGETDADDVGFIRALVADVNANVRPLDRGRVFATGISNGGFMSLRLACEAADLFAAVAAVSASMPVELGARCRPAKTVAVLTINGTGDSLVPFVGGYARTAQALRGAIWSTDRTVAFWSRHNRCQDPPVVRVLPDRDPTDGSYVIESEFRGCAGAPVKLLRVEGGGHTWPGAVQAIPSNMIGTTNRDIDATETIWGFFRSAPASEPPPPLAPGAPSALQSVSTSAGNSR